MHRKEVLMEELKIGDVIRLRNYNHVYVVVNVENADNGRVYVDVVDKYFNKIAVVDASRFIVDNLGRTDAVETLRADLDEARKVIKEDE